MWIPLAWLVFVASVVVAYLGVFATVDALGEEVAPPSTFSPGQPATFELAPEDRPVLYASTPKQVYFECEANTASGGGVALTPPGYRATFTADGRIWEYVFDIGVTAPGTYRITCTAPADSGIVFGVGRQFGGEQAAGTATGVMLYGLLVFAAFVLAVVVSVLVPVFRVRARRGLARPWPPHVPGGR